MTHAMASLSAVDFALGAVSTVVGCVAAVALPQEADGWMALIVATTGMITAVGAVTTSLVRIWAEQRRSEREETSKRQEMLTKLAELKHTIQSDRARLDALEAAIERLNRQHSCDPRD